MFTNTICKLMASILIGGTMGVAAIDAHVVGTGQALACPNNQIATVYNPTVYAYLVQGCSGTNTGYSKLDPHDAGGGTPEYLSAELYYTYTSGGGNSYPLGQCNYKQTCPAPGSDSSSGGHSGTSESAVGTYTDSYGNNTITAYYGYL